jgi:SAM-dependent methyltransferase
MDSSAEFVAFVCNICDTCNRVPRPQIGREVASCRCGSTVRLRAIVHTLSLALYGKSLPLMKFREDRSVSGAGLSDWPGYAELLAKKFRYRNTFFHTEPRLDITAPPHENCGTLDFLISSEVFEHIPPPVSRAFDGAFSMLKPGGHLILTVPYNGGDVATVEHYPDLRDFTLAKVGHRHCVVVLRTDDTMVLDPHPIFHGGPGQTLEMRVFGERDLMDNLRTAGFEDIRVISEGVPSLGIYFDEQWSLPILARKPR